MSRERDDLRGKRDAATGAAKEGAKRVGGAAAGAAYDATGAAERGAKRAGSLFSRAFGAGKRKAQDVAGAPGRRRERKEAERHRSNLRQQATARRVAASEDRRDARKQSPSTVQQGRTGYTNGHDTGLGGGQGERSAAIPKFDSPSKIQQTDAAAGKAPQQPKPYTPKKPKFGEAGYTDWKAMEKAVVSLQKFLDDCGCEGDTLMQNKATKGFSDKETMAIREGTVQGLGNQRIKMPKTQAEVIRSGGKPKESNYDRKHGRMSRAVPQGREWSTSEPAKRFPSPKND